MGKEREGYNKELESLIIELRGRHTDEELDRILFAIEVKMKEEGLR